METPVQSRRLRTNAAALTLILLLIAAIAYCGAAYAQDLPEGPEKRYDDDQLKVKLEEFLSEPDAYPRGFRRVLRQVARSCHPDFPELLRRLVEEYARHDLQNASFLGLKYYWTGHFPKPVDYLVQNVRSFEAHETLAVVSLALLAANPELGAGSSLIDLPELSEEALQERKSAALHNLYQMLKLTTRLHFEYLSLETFEEKYRFLRNFSLFVSESSKETSELEAPDQAWARRRFYELSVNNPRTVARELSSEATKASSAYLENVKNAIGEAARRELEKILSDDRR